MKLKKNIKVLIIILAIILVLVIGFLVVPKNFLQKEGQEAKVIESIDNYGYVLKDNKSKKYQLLFKDLIKILNSKENVDETKYASKLAEMFVVDFYSLADKSSKTDIGGVEIVHPDILANFLENAENTFYKYVESNIYNNRNQELPEVDIVTVESIETTSYTYGQTTDEKAYSVNVVWTYKDNKFTEYQNKANLIFVHSDKKLYLVELK